MSSAVVALAFIGQVDRLGQAFLLSGLALLPALVLLGVLTYLRLVQTAIEDLFYARAINRIRRHYLELDPAANRWLVLCGFDDLAGVLAAMGLASPGAARSHRHLWSHAATMVAVVASIIGGVLAALAADAVSGGQLPVAASAVLGVLVTVWTGESAWCPGQPRGSVGRQRSRSRYDAHPARPGRHAWSCTGAPPGTCSSIRASARRPAPDRSDGPES